MVPIVTAGADRFVAAETFAALARGSPGGPVPAPPRADLYVIAPLTANTLAKLAHGLADNVLTEAALAHRGPLLVAPAMNARMWSSTRRRRRTPRRFARVASSSSGPTRASWPRASRASGGWPSPRRSPSACPALLGATRAVCCGQRVLVTAGGTREPLDAVRFIGNRSSGRMGVALAAEARRRGADVTLVAANLARAAPRGRGRRGARPPPTSRARSVARRTPTWS